MEKELEIILNDKFLKTIQTKNFNSSEYISNLIQSVDITELIDLYLDYQEKEKRIDNYLENFALDNVNFLNSQFNLPDKYGSCFDQIKNNVMQSKRKIIQSREIMKFNFSKLKKLKNEIFELSSILEELSILDKLNEDLLDITKFIKNELFLQCSLIFIKIKEEMNFLKEKKEDNSTLIYFEKIVDKKEKEFLYLLKERSFTIIFDVFIEKYNKDYFSIFEQKTEESDLQFETDTLNFKYFEDFIINYKNDYTKYYNNSSLNLKYFNKELFKIKEMINLFFDINVFTFLEKELENSRNIDFLEDYKILEIIKSANKLNLIDILINDLLQGFDFKLTQYFLKFSKFLIYVFRDSSNVAKIKSNINFNFNNDYFILANLQDICFSELFVNCLMKLIIIFWQKIGFIFRISEKFDRKNFNKIFEKFFDVLKVYVENFFFSKNMITFFNSDIFSYSEILRKKFNFNHTHIFFLINKMNPHLNLLIKKFCKFIGQPEKSKIINIHLENFEDSLFLKFKLKIQNIYERNIFNNKNFNKIEKKGKVTFNKDTKEIFHKNTNMINIIKYNSNSDKNSKFFEGISQKKYSIKVINDFNKFCRDLNFFLETNLVQNNFIYKQFLQFYNRAIFDIIKIINKNIKRNKNFKVILEYKKEQYFKQNIKKIKKFLFSNISNSKKGSIKNKLESFLEIDHKFDFKKIKIDKFYTTQTKIEFYEKCFISFQEFYKNENFFIKFLLTMWNYLDVKTLNLLSLSLNITFELEDTKQDLKAAKQAIIRNNKSDSIVKKLEARVDLTFEENIILVIYYYFAFRDIIIELLFFLKFNFDFMIFEFFEESSLSLGKLNDYDKKFFNTSGQIFEFKKLMMSFNKIAKNYITDDKLKKYFFYKSLDLFYSRFHKFIFEIKLIFLDNKKYIKNYYLEFSKILASLDIMDFYKEEINENSQNYKLMKKLLFAQDIDEIDEIGITFGLDENSDELSMAKDSIKFYNKIQKTNRSDSYEEMSL